EAVAQYRAALKIRPDYVTGLRGLAFVLATDPDAAIRSGAEALDLAQQADRLSGGANPVIKGTLSAAFAEVGRFPDAIAAAELALQLATAQNNMALANALRQQIGLYQAGSPFRVARAGANPGGPKGH